MLVIANLGQGLWLWAGEDTMDNFGQLNSVVDFKVMTNGSAKCVGHRIITFKIKISLNFVRLGDLSPLKFVKFLHYFGLLFLTQYVFFPEKSLSVTAPPLVVCS